MRTIVLDASNWKTPSAFCEAIYDALGDPQALPLPHRFGYSIDALPDVVVYDGMAYLKPPYAVHIKRLSLAPESVRWEVKTVAALVAKERGDVEVSIVIDDV